MITSQIPCKFFTLGTCKAGSSCKFSHNYQKTLLNHATNESTTQVSRSSDHNSDNFHKKNHGTHKQGYTEKNQTSSSNSSTFAAAGLLESTSSKENLVCMFFVKGNCRYGKHCALPHDKPNGNCIVTKAKSIHHRNPKMIASSSSSSGLQVHRNGNVSQEDSFSNNRNKHHCHLLNGLMSPSCLHPRKPSSLRIQTAIFHPNAVNTDKMHTKDAQSISRTSSSASNSHTTSRSQYYSLADPRSPRGLPHFGAPPKPTPEQLFIEDERELPRMDDEDLETPILPSSLKELLTPIEQMRLSSSFRSHIHLSTAEPSSLIQSPRPGYLSPVDVPDGLISPLDIGEDEMFSLEIHSSSSSSPDNPLLHSYSSIHSSTTAVNSPAMTYSQIAKKHAISNGSSNQHVMNPTQIENIITVDNNSIHDLDRKRETLCPFALQGQCKFDENCR